MTTAHGAHYGAGSDTALVLLAGGSPGSRFGARPLGRTPLAAELAPEGADAQRSQQPPQVIGAITRHAAPFVQWLHHQLDGIADDMHRRTAGHPCSMPDGR